MTPEQLAELFVEERGKKGDYPILSSKELINLYGK